MVRIGPRGRSASGGKSPGRFDGMISEEDIGKKIREIRLAKGITLQRLAEMTDFTKGYISKLEHSDKGPPVATLMRIAKALEVTVSDILEERGETERFCLVKPGERVVISRKDIPNEYNYESLAHKFSRRIMDVYLVTRKPYPKRRRTSFKHPGHEIMFMLQGSMEFVYRGQTHIVKEGDCLYFDASYEHHGNNMGDTDVKFLMVVCNPEAVGSDQRFRSTSEPSHLRDSEG